MLTCRFGPNPENPAQIQATRDEDGNIVMPPVQRLQAELDSPASYWLQQDKSSRHKKPLLQYLAHAREVEAANRATNATDDDGLDTEAAA